MKFTQAVNKLRLGKNGLLQKRLYSNLWEVQEEFIWYLDYDNKDAGHVIIPKGFCTNFGSIPRLLQSIFSPTKYLGYILHDYLVSKKGEIKTSNGLDIPYTRTEADRILFKAIRVEKANIIEGLCIYLGVTLGTIWSKINS